MNLGEPRDNLLARVAWLPDSRQISAVKLNRIQNKLDLFVADIATGNASVVLHEEDPSGSTLAASLSFWQAAISFFGRASATGSDISISITGTDACRSS